MVGLSAAWFLRSQGVEVTVVDREHPGAGASWGNAGWLAPALTAPLPEPGVLGYGIRAALSPSSPVYVPLRPDLSLWRFLAGFARNSTDRRWGVSMRAYAPLNRGAIQAFDELTSGGVDAPTHPADTFLACYRTAQQRSVLLHELEQIRAAGQDVDFRVIDGDDARAIEPALSRDVGWAVQLRGQRFIDPPAFVAALASSLRERGGVIRDRTDVRSIEDDADGVTIVDRSGERRRFDAVVLANGAAIGSLAAPFGVRQVVQAGRGYSFSVTGDSVPAGPVYFPTQRVACTPLPSAHGRRLRVAGMMEFRPADAPLDRRRVAAIVDAVRPLLDGVDLDDRADEWVGSRPCTADGLPLVGATRSPRVFVAGGHGMWGVALGPVTGKLLAERILTGVNPAELTPLDPLR